MNNIIKLIVYKKVNKKIINDILFYDEHYSITDISDDLIDNIYSYFEHNKEDNSQSYEVTITDYDNNISYVYLANNGYIYLIIINTINTGKLNKIYFLLNELIIDISQIYSVNGTKYLSLIYDLVNITNININLDNKHDSKNISDQNNDQKFDKVNDTIEIIKQNVMSTIDNLKKADQTIIRLEEKTEINKNKTNTGHQILKQINSHCVIM